MKKPLTILLTSSLALSLAACSSQPPAKPGDTTSTTKTDTTATQTQDVKPEKGAHLLLWDNGGTEGKWAQYVAQQFTKKYGIPVKYQMVSHTDAPGKLQTDGPAGLGADVFDAAHDHVGQMVQSGVISENYYPDEYMKKDNFLPSAVSATSMTKDGKTTDYGYPISVETYALFYNKDLVKTPPKTMDELIKDAKSYNDPAAKKYGFMMEVGNYYILQAFLGGYGGTVFGKNNTDPNQVTLNSEAGVKTGELLQKIHKELLPLKSEDVTADVISSEFNAKNLMFRITGPWDLPNHEAAKVNFGVAPLPTLDNGQHMKSFSGVKAYYVNAYSKYPNAAALFAKFATSDEMLMKRYEMTGQLPPKQSLLDKPEVKNDPYIKGFAEQMQYAVPMPNIPEMVSVWDPAGKAFVSMWDNNTDPKATLDKAVQQIKDAIATSKK